MISTVDSAYLPHHSSALRLSTNTGIRAVDLGMPQLSMHSIREMMGCEDLIHAANLFEAYFRDFRSVDYSLRNVDHF